MKWLRFRAGGRERFGALAGDKVQAYEGEMFGEKRASGEEFAVDAIEWLTPSQPGKRAVTRRGRTRLRCRSRCALRSRNRWARRTSR